MRFKDLRRELGEILPEDHPFLKKFDQSLTPNMVISVDETTEEKTEEPYDPNKSYLQNLMARAVDLLDDWKRGIRDWSEVEPVLNEVRDEVQT